MMATGCCISPPAPMVRNDEFKPKICPWKRFPAPEFGKFDIFILLK